VRSVDRVFHRQIERRFRYGEHVVWAEGGSSGQTLSERTTAPYVRPSSVCRRRAVICANFSAGLGLSVGLQLAGKYARHVPAADCPVFKSDVDAQPSTIPSRSTRCARTLQIPVRRPQQAEQIKNAKTGDSCSASHNRKECAFHSHGILSARSLLGLRDTK